MASQRRLLRPVHLTLDWDSTLTVNDTLSIFGQLPKARDARLNVPYKPTHKWDDFAKAYLEDYSAHKHSPFYPTSPDPQKYSDWLVSLHTVEYASAQRVSDSAFFRGVTTADVSTVAQAALTTREMQLRPGWQNLFALFLPSANSPVDSRVSILSVNWSETFIRSSLRSAARALHDDESRQRQLVQNIDDMEIQANEIDDLNEGSSGRLVGNIRTAADKLQYMSLSREYGRGVLEVYVGDSATDYECLSHAGLGIWICDCPETDFKQRFREVFKPLELDVRPLGQYNGDSDRLYWAANLEQVAQMLVGLGGEQQDP